MIALTFLFFVEMELSTKLISSQKGKHLLSHMGFVYVEEKQTKNKTYWRCQRYTSRFKCPGRVHTMKGVLSVIQKHDHNHMPGVTVKRRVKSEDASTKDDLKYVEVFQI